ncbi:hypothetical protein BC332_28248 [Capsicum chinense]|nr:hypothetical protein BC332_28248 [Capsicum chinense]
MNMGMAVEDPTEPCGVELVIKDYPYAADSLLIWSVIKELVESHIQRYYAEPEYVKLDVEIQAINFGQYLLEGDVIYRHTLMWKLIPQEEDSEYKQFLFDLEQMVFSSLPTQFQATKFLAV